MITTRFVAFQIMLIGLMSGCGGGGSSTSESLIPASTPNPLPVAEQLTVDDWQQGIFPNSNTFFARCELPRTGSNSLGQAFVDQQGSANTEKMWLRSWSYETYLWYQDLPDLDPEPFTVAAYFDELKTDARTNSNRLLDEFHFSQNTEEYLQRTNSGVVGGYGFRLALFNPEDPALFVLFTEPNSPATNASTPILRGARIISVNGDPAYVQGVGSNRALFPRTIGETHTIEFLNPGETESSTVTLSSAPIVTSPVQNARIVESGENKVGYVLFNSHISTSLPMLVDAFTTFEQENIDELVLDLRYNGGGALSIAARLSYMIAGEVAASGREFARILPNDKRAGTNIPFFNTWIPPNESGSARLPSVSLSRVFILSSGSTCSASEAIINGLQGVGIEVVQIGSTTCGKPFGFFPQDNCGTTYFTVQIRTANDLGFSDYADGFSPQNQLGTFGISLPGCFVGDDLSQPLGDEQEARFATALNYINEGVCSSVTGTNGLNAKPAVNDYTEPQILDLKQSESVTIFDL